MARAVVELAGCTRDYGGIRAVAGLDLVVHEGELLSLLGPSGCGKTTTLNLIAGFVPPTAGRVRIDGQDVTDRPAHQRGLGVVFQSYALFPHLTVAENLVFGLKVRRVGRRDRATRLKRVVELLGLGGLTERKPAELSGGQQQRVALGRALIAEARVCLMDEPRSNRDAQLRVEMRREIRSLQQRLGITMIYVTHDQDEAMSMADRIILMRAGRIEQDATPAELYARPATVFAGSFVGTPPMNIVALEDSLRGAVIAGSDSALCHGAGAGLMLGLRPELIRLSAGGGVPAEVLTAEYLGADTILTCRVGQERLAVRLAGPSVLTAGAAVRLAWSPQDAHVFDAATGRRINSALAGAAYALQEGGAVP